MGGFIHMTALRSTDSNAIGLAIVRYANDHGVPADVLPADAAHSPETVSVLQPNNGWSIVD